MSEKEEYTKEQEYFNDWYSDNCSFLWKEFTEKHSDLYGEFVQDEFREHLANREY